MLIQLLDVQLDARARAQSVAHVALIPRRRAAEDHDLALVRVNLDPALDRVIFERDFVHEIGQPERDALDAGLVDLHLKLYDPLSIDERDALRRNRIGVSRRAGGRGCAGCIDGTAHVNSRAGEIAATSHARRDGERLTDVDACGDGDIGQR